MEELKPCPFCGGKARLKHLYTAGIKSHSSAECSKCHIKTDYYVYQYGERNVIEAWNRRANGTTTRNGRYRTKYGRKVPLCECCGYSIGDLRWKFCPSCGAEVVDE